MSRLWIVEILATWRSNHNVWEPTVSASLRKMDGELELAKWRGRNPSDKFRLKKYVPAK